MDPDPNQGLGGQKYPHKNRKKLIFEVLDVDPYLDPDSINPDPQH